MYLAASFANHNCDPNTSFGREVADTTMKSYLRLLKTPKRHEVLFTALRDIAVGEELTISYVGRELSYKERHAHLLSGYGFECNCMRCNREKVEQVVNA